MHMYNKCVVICDIVAIVYVHTYHISSLICFPSISSPLTLKLTSTEIDKMYHYIIKFSHSCNL